MQSVPREWLDFLRQQFPKDSRIQLTEIGGNPRPISPDSTGKLDYIDDAGQFHVKWDIPHHAGHRPNQVGTGKRDLPAGADGALPEADPE